jgi:hypothetical protein
MQLTQNKRLRSLLIEFFHRFFCLCVHFRTPAFSLRSPRRLRSVGPRLIWPARHLPALLVLSDSAEGSEVERPRTTRHWFSNSNRVTYEKLEIDLSHTKQTLELVSNRGNLRLSRRISSRFRTRLATPNFRASLPRTSSPCSRVTRLPKLLENLLKHAESISSRFLIDNFHALLRTAPHPFQPLDLNREHQLYTLRPSRSDLPDQGQRIRGLTWLAE